MEYFKLNGIDYSMYVSKLKVKTAANYNAQTNAAGNTIVDYINSKRQVEVEIIAIDDIVMKAIKANINKFNVQVSYRNPDTNQLETINAILPDNEVDYYTIQGDKVMYNAFTLSFNEL